MRRGKATSADLHEVYHITDRENGMVYVGQCKTRQRVVKGYFCGSERVKRTARKHGRGRFRREIISQGLTKAEALALEEHIVDAAFVARPDTYNLIEGGTGGRNPCESTVKKHSTVAKALWQDPKYKASVIAGLTGIKKTFKDPKAWSKHLSERWNDPAFREAVNGHKFVPVSVRGRAFRSMGDAGKFEGVCGNTISSWVKEGRNGARRLDEEPPEGYTVVDEANTKPRRVVRRLSKSDMSEICRRYDSGEGPTSIAESFGVSRSRISTAMYKRRKRHERS